VSTQHSVQFHAATYLCVVLVGSKEDAEFTPTALSALIETILDHRFVAWLEYPEWNPFAGKYHEREGENWKGLRSHRYSMPWRFEGNEVILLR
jgi:hypothetical protein